MADALVKLPHTRACHARRCADAWPRTIPSDGARTCGAFRRSTRITSPAWGTCSTRPLCRTPRPEAAGGLLRRERHPAHPRVRRPIRAKPGHIESYDCEYRRNGTVNLLVFLDVNRPRRRMKVTERRTPKQFSGLHARARRRPLFQGRVHSRVDPFGRRALSRLPGYRSATLLRRLEFHCAPKHASWLNMVKIEIGVLAANAWIAASNDPCGLHSARNSNRGLPACPCGCQ
jgi:hypothetical protein